MNCLIVSNVRCFPVQIDFANHCAGTLADVFFFFQIKCFNARSFQPINFQENLMSKYWLISQRQINFLIFFLYSIFWRKWPSSQSVWTGRLTLPSYLRGTADRARFFTNIPLPLRFASPPPFPLPPPLYFNFEYFFSGTIKYNAPSISSLPSPPFARGFVTWPGTVLSLCDPTKILGIL